MEEETLTRKKYSNLAVKNYLEIYNFLSLFEERERKKEKPSDKIIDMLGEAKTRLTDANSIIAMILRHKSYIYPEQLFKDVGFITHHLMKVQETLLDLVGKTIDEDEYDMIEKRIHEILAN